MWCAGFRARLALACGVLALTRCAAGIFGVNLVAFLRAIAVASRFGPIALSVVSVLGRRERLAPLLGLQLDLASMRQLGLCLGALGTRRGGLLLDGGLLAFDMALTGSSLAPFFSSFLATVMLATAEDHASQQRQYRDRHQGGNHDHDDQSRSGQSDHCHRWLLSVLRVGIPLPTAAIANRSRRFVYARRRMALEPGDDAPDFELQDQDGREVRLSDFRGQPVVLYFYPKASTPGCTTQACGVRDHRPQYDAARAVVLGVSPDPVRKLEKFADDQALDFRLLADEGHAVAERYGVWVQKSMYGRTYWGNERTSFVIDPDGRVAAVLRKVKPAEHDELVLKALSALA